MRRPGIAIIDDNRRLRASLLDLVRAAGYRARAFASAGRFLASPGLLAVDCLIVDVRMPEMSGLDLLRRFRRGGGTAPLILMTALADERLGSEAVAAGAFCMLTKPFEADLLLDRIAKAVAGERP